MRRCAPWSSTPPGRPLRLAADLDDPEPGAGRGARRRPRLRRLPHRPAHRRRRARGPRGGRSSPATRSSARSSRPATARLEPGAASASRGSGGRAASAGTAAAAARTCASAARFTGLDIDGGYAERAVADARFCFAAARRLRRPRGRAAAVRGADRPPRAADGRRRRAPRPLRLRRLGAHRLPGRAAIRAGACSPSPARDDAASQAFALSLGCEWAGDARARRRRSSTPRSSSPPSARSCRPRCGRSTRGGVVVCAGIHMSDIPSFPYADLWRERSIRSVANLTRARRARAARPRPARAGAHARHDVSARRGPTTRSTTCAPGALEGAAVLVTGE